MKKTVSEENLEFPVKIYYSSNEGYFKIPKPFQQYFPDRVKLLIDCEHCLVALQPSSDIHDYPTSHWRVWCSSFLKTYKIKQQTVIMKWIEPKNYLLGKLVLGDSN